MNMTYLPRREFVKTTSLSRLTSLPGLQNSRPSIRLETIQHQETLPLGVDKRWPTNWGQEDFDVAACDKLST